MKKRFKFLDKNFRSIILYLIGFSTALILFILSEKARSAVVITAFIALNVLVVSYKRFIPSIPIEIEILTLGIVLCTIQFGFKAGLVIALLGGIFSFVLSGNLSPFAFPMLGGYVIIALSSFFLKGLSIQVVGMVASILNNGFVFISYHYLFKYDLIKNVSFSLSNLFVNFVLFLNIAPVLQDIIR